MAIRLIWSALLGAVLGRLFKVLVLVPACAFLLVAIVVRSAEHGLLSRLLEFAVLNATLQIGYVSGLVSHLIPSVSERRGTKAAPRAQAPQDPAQRAKLPGKIAKAECHAGHSREASTAFSEACTAFLRIMSRIGADAFEHFRSAVLRSAPSSPRCQRDMSLRIRSHCISARRTLRCRRNGLSRCFAVMS